MLAESRGFFPGHIPDFQQLHLLGRTQAEVLLLRRNVVVIWCFYISDLWNTGSAWPCHLVVFLSSREMISHRKRLITWLFFLSSRETISQPGIEPPTAPIGRLRPVFGSFLCFATFYRVDLHDGTCVVIHNEASTNNRIWRVDWGWVSMHVDQTLDSSGNKDKLARPNVVKIWWGRVCMCLL